MSIKKQYGFDKMIRSISLLRHQHHRQDYDFLVVIILLLTTESIKCLKLLELRVPARASLGTRVQLSCRWQLGPDEVLYSVKWYKDGKEFFRHVPKDHESFRKFSLPGVDVNETDCSGGNVTLSSASLETSGRYRCEVSGEKPLFPTVSERADLEIIVPPDQGPVITGFLSRYNIEDTVQANCTSGRSKPATELTWYINGEPASSNSHLPQYHKYKDGFEATSLILDMKIDAKNFRSYRFQVKCLATLAPFYWKSTEKSALIRRREVNEHHIERGNIIEISLAHKDSPIVPSSSQKLTSANKIRIIIVTLHLWSCVIF